jgi:hypothetical protein
LSEIQGTEVNLYTENFPDEYYKGMSDYGNASFEISKSGNWTNFYRDAVNHNGEPMGNHELKSLKLKVNDKRDAV